MTRNFQDGCCKSSDCIGSDSEVKNDVVCMCQEQALNRCLSTLSAGFFLVSLGITLISILVFGEIKRHLVLSDNIWRFSPLYAACMTLFFLTAIESFWCISHWSVAPDFNIFCCWIFQVLLLSIQHLLQNKEMQLGEKCIFWVTLKINLA